jgi:hypothetical protein
MGTKQTKLESPDPERARKVLGDKKPDPFNTERARKFQQDKAFNFEMTDFLTAKEIHALSAVNRKSYSSMNYVIDNKKRRTETLFHDPYPYPLDLSKESVWTVTLGLLKYTDEFLKILVRDCEELLEYINAKTYLTHIEYIGIRVEEIKFTFVCEKKANINEAYIAKEIKGSIFRLAEHSDGKYYENLLVKEVKLETEKSKYSFRKSKSPTRKTKKSKKTPTMHKSKKTL